MLVDSASSKPEGSSRAETLINSTSGGTLCASGVPSVIIEGATCRTALLLADSSAAHPKKGAKFIPTSPSTHDGYSFVPLHPLQTTLKVYPRPNGGMYLCGLGGSDYVDPPRLKAGGDCDKPEVILPDPSRVTAATKSFKGMTSIGNEDPTVTQVCTPRVCGCS